MMPNRPSLLRRIGMSPSRTAGGASESTGAPARTRIAAASALAIALAAPVLVTPSAAAQEDPVEVLIAELEELGLEAERNSEEVTRLDGEVSEQEARVAELQSEVDTATLEAEAARGEVDAHRDDIAEFARQRMRGEVVDPMTAVLGANDAQDALDRSTYVSQLSRDKEEILDGLSRHQRNAADGFARAAGARATAEFELGQLEHARNELSSQSEALDRRTSEVMERVDALSPEALERWRNKDNPMLEGLDALVGTAGVVDAAVGKTGSPYSWGAAGPDAFDCSGLMYWAYQQMGKTIPRTSQAQLAGGTPVSRGDLQPGDIIGFYEGITHVGMYVGNGMIVHASTYGVPVQVVSIEQGGPYMGAVRY
ncbi:NlpC/P60 family protein [uncultured Corynebacterium sp.]|uniref:NlpC/P60 family protein n=1 Tax=uncultured Corynebacterium sp. TaxID=159447 RepID=UPI00261A13A6|nr:NlpC/P60 family protein [uncultured Corynebacterium sp.]